MWDLVTGAAGFVLFISLFLHWYLSNGDTATGFESFKIIDKLLLITGLLAMSVPVVAYLRKTPQATQKLTFIVAVLAVISLICVIGRLANPAEFDAVPAPVTRTFGAWIALAAAIVLTLASIRAIAARRAERVAGSAAVTS